MEEGFESDPDYTLGKILKYSKLNPVGEDAYLMPDGVVVFDEDKIIRAQRIFKHNYWRPDGRGSRRVLKKYTSRPAHDATVPGSNNTDTMYATILSLEAMEYPPLVPAPSVTDYDDISAALEKSPKSTKGLMDGPHLIVTSYRGGFVYLDNGACMYRCDTGAVGANGYLGHPVGEEGCIVGLGGKWWRARVTYE